jgi:type IV secretory pathway VirB10-like protein
MNDLAKLNRLRVNAGKKELKFWKATPKLLDESIKKFEDAGFTDALPGANTDAAPVSDDPEVQAARPADEPAPKKEPTKTNGKPSLARGLDTESYAHHSRKAVRDIREKEKKDKKAEAARLSPEDKQQIKDEAKRRKGDLDPKTAKGKRQKQHIADKQAKRKAEGKTAKSREKNADEVTVADIARELNIDPKIARAKMRRYEGKDNYPNPVKGERWTFPKSAKAAIAKILK